MAAVVDYVVAPPVPRDVRSTKEIFTALHKETVELGPRGVLVVFGVLFSSSGVLLVRGVQWLYRRIRGYT